ncbi:MAG TPA: terminase small subunit [Acidimicrobiales bacterium]|nr:terminase small subunit [Acidimicrobiales bacterium]
MTEMQRQFVEHYCRCWIGTRAAIAAGYERASAHDAAHRLLRDPEVSAAIRERVSVTAMETDEVLHHLAEVARGVQGAYLQVGEGGYIVSFDLAAMVADGHGNLISSIEPTKYGQRVRFESRLKALEILARCLKLDGLTSDQALALLSGLVRPAGPEAEAVDAGQGLLEPGEGE